MLKAKNIIYGFCRYTNPPKNKYLISLYRSEELHIIAVFPTSQRRAGVAVPKHGCNIRDNQVISYVFDAGHPIGKKKDSDEDFAFPLQTTIPFDYCFREGEQDELPPSGEIQSAASDKISHSRVCYTNFAAKVIIFFVNLSPTAQILLLYGRFCLRLRPQPLNLTSSCRTSWQPEADSR